MNPAETIAETLDRHLRRPTEVVVFGAAALLLDQKFAVRLGHRTTNDIDIIIPTEKEMHVNTDRSFWEDLEKTNRELENTGLYITHIFPEREVALTPEWKEHTVALSHPQLTKLNLVRPRILDLVVSKMGRGDAQDRVDVRNMLRLHREVTSREITAAEVADAARRAHVPEAYREIFPRASEQIIAVAREAETREAIQPRVSPPSQGPHPRLGGGPGNGPRMSL